MNRVIAVYIIYLLPAYIYGQISWNVNAEAGYFKTSGGELILKDDLVTRINGQVKFNFSKSAHEASLLLNIHPEYLGSKNKTGILKFKGLGNYFIYQDKFNWGVSFSVIKNNYFGDVLDVKYDIFSFQTSLTTSFLSRPITTLVGYTYQNVNYSGSINYDLIFNESEYLFINSRYFSTGLGIYAERFNIENEYTSFPAVNLSNNGWRTGPLINIRYLKEFLFSSAYRVLFHYSNSVGSPSFEHQVTFVAGKVFFENYSLFLLADFYFRDFKLKNGTPVNFLIYSPVNQENKYSLKLSCELNKNTEIFFRSGYSKENVDYITNNIAGWSFTLGFELKQ